MLEYDEHVLDMQEEIGLTGTDVNSDCNEGNSNPLQLLNYFDDEYIYYTYIVMSNNIILFVFLDHLQ